MTRRRLGDLAVALAALAFVVLLYTVDSGADEGRDPAPVGALEDRPAP
jgi:hypothetical protein